MVWLEVPLSNFACMAEEFCLFSVCVESSISKQGSNVNVLTFTITKCGNYPHTQHEWGKVIGVGVHIYVVQKIFFESYFSDRLTFTNIRGRTSRQIYRLALPLLSPEALSWSSKSRIFFI